MVENSVASPSARSGRISRKIALSVAGAVLGTAAFTTGPSLANSTVGGGGITEPAALQQGLQGAERLNPPSPRPTLPPPPVVVPPTTPPVGSDPGSTVGSGLPANVEQLLNILNSERTSRGLNPLLHHEQLAQAGRAHAADYFSLNCLTSLSHTGRDGSDPGDRIARTGLRVRTWGENLACNNQSAAHVMQAWMNSSGHRANILNPAFTHVGLSISTDAFGHPYWVQVFGTPR